MLPDKLMTGPIQIANNERLQLSLKPTNWNWLLIFKHLYFTSNREIQMNDWFLFHNIEIRQCLGSDGKFINCRSNGSTKDFTSVHANFCKKLECSSDSSLELPLIPQSFIEAYVESQGTIDEVMIEMDEDVFSLRNAGKDWTSGYKPKLRKDNTVIVFKVKDSWTREEVITLCKAARSTAGEINIDEWIERNL